MAVAPGRRADATQNREKIIAAAYSAFGRANADVSMAEIARLAGVGMATLYRNFPGRRELLEALYADEVDSVCAAAELAEGDSAGARFLAWLHAFVEFVTSKRAVATELLEHTGRGDQMFSDSRVRVTAAGVPLLVAAQESREIRSGLTLDQILDMLHAVAAIPGEQGYREPIVASALAGLRPDH